MRISDWSSDVCSSDLNGRGNTRPDFRFLLVTDFSQDRLNGRRSPFGLRQGVVTVAYRPVLARPTQPPLGDPRPVKLWHAETPPAFDGYAIPHGFVVRGLTKHPTLDGTNLTNS